MEAMSRVISLSLTMERNFEIIVCIKKDKNYQDWGRLIPLLTKNLYNLDASAICHQSKKTKT